jgi:hypothetical protein
MHDQLGKDIDEITMGSVVLYEQEGKRLCERTHAIIADYHSKVKESQMKTMHCRQRMEGNALQEVYVICIDICSFTEEEL